MAAYFHCNSESGDGLQTLILMNPAYTGYSTNQPAVTLNVPHAPPSSQAQHFVGVPVPVIASQDPSRDDVSAMRGFFPRVHADLYNKSVETPTAREAPRANQGLSLSLSGGSSSNGAALSSKYLKAAQELLDEVVKVRGAKKGGEFSAVDGGDDKSGVGSENHGHDQLNTTEKQEIQMKRAKLVNMLDKVEKRYREYNHQMRVVISWFEQAAGIGSAKTYTSLALQTISRQFRCLKDAILAQIRAASKNLGDEDSLGGKVDGSKLKYVDNQIRQQRAPQQLGMIQHNAWRPQRGLPERSVSVLRAWLFEHFLHPYPKDSDKMMLAKQTGLSRSQVSNWFINARVRLWKPMVEEMYMEEVKEQERNGSDEKSSKSQQNDDSASKLKIQDTENQDSFDHSSSASISMLTSSTEAMFHLIASSEMGNIARGSPKKAGIFQSLDGIPLMNMESKPTVTFNEHIPMKFGIERQSANEFTLMGAPTNFIEGLGSYPIDQFQAPYSSNAVSLTLGLPHCENLIMPRAHQTFLSNQTIQLASRRLEQFQGHE